MPDIFDQAASQQQAPPPVKGDIFDQAATTIGPSTNRFGERSSYVQAQLEKQIPGYSIAKDAIGKLRAWANYTEEGKQQHPIQAGVGRLADSLDSMLFGETGSLQTKPEGMKTGFINNPVTGLLMPGVAPEDELINSARDMAAKFKGAAGNEAREVGNWFASKLRAPATSAESAIGQAGKVKSVSLPVAGHVGFPDFMIPEGELGTATNPGWYAKLPVRVRPTAAPEVSPFSGMATSSPESMATLPVRTTPFPGPAEAAPTPNVQMVSKFAKPAPSQIVSPESVASYKVTYQSYPAEQLVRMAQSGDVQAARELIRNPRGVDLSDIPNLRYILEPNALRQPWRNLKR